MPTEPAAAVLLARGLRAEGDISQAQQTLAAQISRHPRSAVLRTELGWVLLDRRDWPGARKAFEEALRLEPESIESRTGLVTAYLARGRMPPRKRASANGSRALRETAASAYSRLVWPWSPAVPPKPSAFSARSSRTIRATWRRTISSADMYVASGDMTRAYDEYQTLAARTPAGCRTSDHGRDDR